MKISPISFSGFNNINKNEKSGRKKGCTSKFLAIPAVIIAGSAIAMYSSQNTNTVNKPVTIPFDSKKTTITDVAKTYNVSENAITDYNSVLSDIQPNTMSELKIPLSFNYIKDEITALQSRLYSNTLSVETRTDIEAKINQLFEKQREQNAVADLYSDGTDLYITINIKNDELSEKLQDKYQFGINIESLKKLFDIEDGAVEENNEISSKWVPTSNNGVDGYYDYTLNWFKNGDVIKVPVSSIRINDIDLSSYSK